MSQNKEYQLVVSMNEDVAAESILPLNGYIIEISDK